ncbi:lectin subunit alpha [Stomoxys calcitrans]|uniref:lectin subunit alpha n=1 Tax=Stomoxys calcitrans TaxID=35570 RepID=UPI0027E2BFB5|nr:lectin subunit alpha [Stomoxys calcitrans]
MNILLRNSSSILACLLAGISTLVTAIPQSYTASDGVEYVIERDQVYNWLQAHTECVGHGLQLAIIDSAEKNQAFEALLRTIFGR